MRNLRKYRKAGPGAAAQKGIAGMVAMMFVLIVALFAMVQAASISSSNMMDSSRQADAVEALFLAESGIERVGIMFVNSVQSPKCVEASFTTGALPEQFAIPGSRGVFRVVGIYTTDFDGTSTLPTTMCRVRVQGEITASGVRRTIDSIVGTTEDVISISSLNPNFNNDPYTGSRASDFANAPLQWSLTGGTQGLPYIGWAKDGGPDGSRSAFTRKTKAGTGVATTGGVFTVPSATPILVTLPKTLRLTFDYRVWTRGNSIQEMQFTPQLVFQNTSTLTTYTFSSSPVTYESGPTITTSQPRQSNGQASDGCGYIDTAGFESGAGGPYEYNSVTKPCDPYPPPSGTTGYESGYVTFSVTGVSGEHKLTGVSFSLNGKDGQITWIWLDNLRLSVPSLNGGGPSKLWREVAS